jgi:sulfane dehydrogenase subunit SoxC
MRRPPRSADHRVAAWQQYLGDGVDARPTGCRRKYEAHVVRRNVPWLTADSVSSVNFTPLHEMEGIITPNGLCFERHHPAWPRSIRASTG